MKKAQVQVGGRYLAKVSDRVATVRITGESPYGGWDARNEETGRQVRIRSAQRLRGAAPSEREAAPETAAAVLVPGTRVIAQGSGKRRPGTTMRVAPTVGANGETCFAVRCDDDDSMMIAYVSRSEVMTTAGLVALKAREKGEYRLDAEYRGERPGYAVVGPDDRALAWYSVDEVDEARADVARMNANPHDCDAEAVPYTSDGPLGHGWECGVCGRFLQAG